jgi:hypothetical protein
MTNNLTSALDQMIMLYRSAWKTLWMTSPPHVQRVKDRGVIIRSEHGSHYLRADRFKSRIEDMRAWREA